MNKHIIKILTSVFILLCIFTNVAFAAQKEIINFQNITIEQGLSQSLVEFIHQDSLGYMWFATNDGLNRYNGNEFKNYKYNKNNPNSISNSIISSIVEDDDKNLWIGTDGGVNKLNLLTNKITRYLVSEEDKLYSNTVVDELFIDSKGRLWACSRSGLNLYDETTDSFSKVLQEYPELKELQDITEDNMGNIWLSTTKGVYKYNHDNNSIETFFHNENDPNSISENNVFSLYYSEGKIWLGTKNAGLNILDLNDLTIKKYRHSPNDPTSIPSNLIRDIIRDSKGRIWLATDQGLSYFNEENESFTTFKNNTDKHSLLDDNTIHLFEDNLGVIWIGTFNGVSKFHPNENFTIYRNDPKNPNSLSNNSVCGIYEDDNSNLWVGTFNAGVNRIDKKTNTITKYYNDVEKPNSLSSNRIKSITGIDNEIWIATDNGLNKFDTSTDEFTTYKSSPNKNSIVSDEIRTLYIDKSGLLWIGTRGGLSTFDRTNTFTSYNEIFERNGVFEKTINAIYEDNDGIMWIGLGNDGGLVKFNKKTLEIKNYLTDVNTTNSLINNTIRSLGGDNQGNIWIGTTDGLNKLHKETDEFTVFTTAHGLSNDFIYGILVDDIENIWVSTNYGISMYDQVNNNFIRYYEADGVASNEFNGFSYYKNKDGLLYFGGVNGLTEFNPVTLKLSMETSNIIIDSIKTSGGVDLKVEDTITLNFNSRELYIKFFIPEYKNMSQMQYAYKLEGLDNDWTFSGNENYARYASLPPGKYTMKIAGRNYNGVWSDISSIKVNVKNSIFTTPLAYFIYLIILGIIIYIYYNNMRLLDSLVSQRTEELNNELKENEFLYKKLIKAEQYKNNYFVNLSHELRTPLNVIISIEQLIKSLINSGKKIEDTKLEYYMNTLGGNSKRLLNLINNIIDTSKIDSGSYKLNKENANIVEIIEDTALSMVELAKYNDIDLIIDPQIEELYVYCDKLDIERSIVNLIGNAIKFTPPNGNITVTINEIEDMVRISVIDTGIGIDKKYHKDIFDRFGQVTSHTSEEFGGSGLGLTLTKNLITLHGGNIYVTSTPGEGSEFIILLPINL